MKFQNRAFLVQILLADSIEAFCRTQIQKYKKVSLFEFYEGDRSESFMFQEHENKNSWSSIRMPLEESSEAIFCENSVKGKCKEEYF